MYLPKHFAVTDIQAMHQLMREHPLATLVHLGPDGLQANHIPLHLADMAAGPGILQGHVALANPLWREIAETQEVLAIFHGPQAYISPSGYATKAEHGKVVPTWNHATVHAYGTFAARRRPGLAEYPVGNPHPGTPVNPGSPLNTSGNDGAVSMPPMAKPSSSVPTTKPTGKEAPTSTLPRLPTGESPTSATWDHW